MRSASTVWIGSSVCAGSAIDCSGLDGQCALGECNAGSGLCEALAINEGAACDDGKFMWGLSHFDRLAAHLVGRKAACRICAQARTPPEGPVYRRRVNHTKDRLLIPHQRNINRKGVAPADEFLGPVEGIDQIKRLIANFGNPPLCGFFFSVGLVSSCIISLLLSSMVAR